MNKEGPRFFSLTYMILSLLTCITRKAVETYWVGTNEYLWFFFCIFNSLGLFLKQKKATVISCKD